MPVQPRGLLSSVAEIAGVKSRCFWEQALSEQLGEKLERKAFFYSSTPNQLRAETPHLTQAFPKTPMQTN